MPPYFISFFRQVTSNDWWYKAESLLVTELIPSHTSSIDHQEAVVEVIGGRRREKGRRRGKERVGRRVPRLSRYLTL